MINDLLNRMIVVHEPSPVPARHMRKKSIKKKK